MTSANHARVAVMHVEGAVCKTQQAKAHTAVFVTGAGAQGPCSKSRGCPCCMPNTLLDPTFSSLKYTTMGIFACSFRALEELAVVPDDAFPVQSNTAFVRRLLLTGVGVYGFEQGTILCNMLILKQLISTRTHNFLCFCPSREHSSQVSFLYLKPRPYVLSWCVIQEQSSHVQDSFRAFHQPLRWS